MYFDVVEASSEAGYRIRLLFRDGSSGVADLVDYVKPETVFERFKDISFFRAFRIDYGTLTWADGDIDIAPETLYERASGKKIVWGSGKK